MTYCNTLNKDADTRTHVLYSFFLFENVIFNKNVFYINDNHFFKRREGLKTQWPATGLGYKIDRVLLLNLHSCSFIHSFIQKVVERPLSAWVRMMIITLTLANVLNDLLCVKCFRSLGRLTPTSAL